MSKDPVCGAQVDERRPGATTTYEGQTFSFCCSHCKEQFLREPRRYVAKQQPGTAAAVVGEEGMRQMWMAIALVVVLIVCCLGHFLRR